MFEYIFVPKSLALHVLADTVPWTEAESIITLLSIAYQREPLQQGEEYCKYLARSEEVQGRGDFKNTPFGKYGGFIKGKFIPYIAKVDKVYDSKLYFSYSIHHLYNPMFYAKRHKRIQGINEFPTHMWRMPRHVLIRWRYSCRMPMHKNSLTWKRRFATEEFFPPCSIDETIQEFSMLTSRFFDIMCQCDESSVNYGFACHVYFYAHDRLVYMMRSNKIDPKIMSFIGQLSFCLRRCVLVDQPPVKAVELLTGMFRAILPPHLYGAPPFSAYSTTRFYRER